MLPVRKQYHFWPGHQGLDAWDVDRLIRLSAALPVEQVLVSEVREIDSVYWFDDWHTPTVRRIIEHFHLTQQADMSYPIILRPDGHVMDGMHRVARALLEGRQVLDAVRFQVLPPPDYRDCRPEDLPYDRA